MDVALVWVLAILAISLGAILAMNFWTDSGNSQFKFLRRRSKNFLRRKFARFLRLFPTARTVPKRQESDYRSEVPLNKGDLGESLFNSLSPKLLNSSFAEEESAIQLTVEIQKKLPNFYLNISFETGSKPLGILGASGAGKSTLLRCIAGLETPDRGRIVLNGRVLFDSEAKINLPSRDRRVGVLFQDYALFPHLTAAENIAFGLPKGLSRLAIKQRVEAQLAAIQLQGMGNRYPCQLSGGQQQRVALARALASEPEILLFDEPLSALDTHLRYQIEKLLVARLAHYRGVTLFITHNLEEAYRLCPNLAVIERGHLVQQAPKQVIFTHPRTLSIAQLTGCKNFSRAVTVAPHQVSAIDWGCTLQVAESIPKSFSHLGLRAHQLIFTDIPSAENTFPCWLTATSETPHRMTLFLKLNSSPTSPHDYHLQAEVFKEKWAMLQNLPFPWFVQLHSERLLLFSEGERKSEVENSDFEVQYSAL
ncbi:sulfate/molybdate ABC transporter ATP-binding protein [Oscillatoria sp. FACHB-1406]|nr:sulfate/molybdate ABC transporter ATP-binding protein [Oscillatoria sp. FACHB-1406]